MVNRKSFVAMFGALVLGLSAAVSIDGATNSLHTNYLTFSGPVGLPGVTLPPGTYAFERLDGHSPDIVVVRSGDRRKVYFMASTFRVSRPGKLTKGPGVTFGEPRREGPQPILAWFPEGERNGYQFVYGRR